MNKSYLFFALCFLVSLPAIAHAEWSEEKKLIEKEAQAWAQQCKDQFSPQELQFTANYLYFANCHAQSTAQFIQLSHAALQNFLKLHNLSLEDNFSEVTAHFSHVAQKLEKVGIFKLSIIQAFIQCNNHLDHMPEHVTEHIGSIYESQQSILGDLFSSKRIGNTQGILNLQSTMAEQNMAIQQTYSQLNHCINGFRQTEFNPEYIEEDINFVVAPLLHLAQRQQAFLLEQAVTITELQKIQVQLSELDALIYTTYYTALYPVILELETEYQKVFFNDQGLLAVEYQYPLPSPENILPS